MSAEVVDLTPADRPVASAGPAEQGAVQSELDRHAAAVTESMHDVLRCHNSLRARTTGGESDVAALFLLVKICKHGPLRARELAEAIGADPSTVSRQVAALVRNGLVERQADAADGRASLLEATSTGRGRVQQFVDQRTRAMGKVLAHWSPEDRRTFVRLLTEYARNVELHRDEMLSGLNDESLQPEPENGSTQSERSH